MQPRTASPRTRKGITPKTALTHQHPDGTIHALSSDGVTMYVVRLGDVPSCTCPGFTHHGHCYHLDTARTRYPAEYTAPWAVIVPDSEPEPPSPAAPAACPCMLYDTDSHVSGCRYAKAA